MASSNSSALSLDSTSLSLLNRVKGHDQAAWQRLVRLYGPLIDYWIRQAGLQTADAQDVFQEVFRAAAANIGSFRKERPSDSFRGWLRIITRSKLSDQFRRRGSQPQAVGGSEFQRRLQQVPEPAADAGGAEDEISEMTRLRLRALELIRAEFEDRTWQAFWRVTVEGHAVKDVAADLGVTPSAVRLAKSRILCRLREEMEGLEP